MDDGVREGNERWAVEHGLDARMVGHAHHNDEIFTGCCDEHQHTTIRSEKLLTFSAPLEVLKRQLNLLCLRCCCGD